MNTLERLLNKVMGTMLALLALLAFMLIIWFVLIVLAALLSLAAPFIRQALTVPPPPAAAAAAPKQDFDPEPEPYNSYRSWRAETPHLIATWEQLYEAFIVEQIPRQEAVELANAWTLCEAPVVEIRTGRNLGADLYRIGDHGLSEGAGQFHRPIWGTLMDRIDFHTVEGAAKLAAIIRLESIRLGRAPLWPWTCAW